MVFLKSNINKTDETKFLEKKRKKAKNLRKLNPKMEKEKKIQYGGSRKMIGFSIFRERKQFKYRFTFTSKHFLHERFSVYSLAILFLI